MMRQNALLLALILLSASAFAAVAARHSVAMTIRPDLSVYVEEEYLISFANATEKQAFNDTASRSDATMADWGVFGAWQTLKTPSTKMIVTPSLSQASSAIVTLQYEPLEAIQPIQSDDQRDLVGITEDIFSFYSTETDRIALPYEPPTELTIKTAQKLRLADEITPVPEKKTVELSQDGEQYNVYLWSYRRPFNTDKFRIVFEKEKSIQSLFSIDYITDELRTRFGNPVYLIVAIILVALFAIYHKEVGGLIGEAFTGEGPSEDEVVLEKNPPAP